jgi:hypothetical protein
MEKTDRTATNLRAIPHPPFVRSFVIWFRKARKIEGI